MIHNSRSMALKNGDNTYFTGKPCKRGNIEFRYAATGGCLCDECKKARNKSCRSHYEKNKEYYEKKSKNNYIKNGEKIREKRRHRHYKNREKEVQSSKKYYWENRERCINASKKYIENNYADFLMRQSARRAKCRKATPSWADKTKIKKFYQTVQLLNCWEGPRAEVDHIIPLVSDLVCGLHCEENLQILWKHENASKGNRHWPDMP